MKLPFQVTPENRLNPSEKEVLEWGIRTGITPRKLSPGGDPENQVNITQARKEILRIASIPGHRDPLIRRSYLISRAPKN